MLPQILMLVGAATFLIGLTWYVRSRAESAEIQREIVAANKASNEIAAHLKAHPKDVRKPDAFMRQEIPRGGSGGQGARLGDAIGGTGGDAGDGPGGGRGGDGGSVTMDSVHTSVAVGGGKGGEGAAREWPPASSLMPESPWKRRLETLEELQAEYVVANPAAKGKINDANLPPEAWLNDQLALRKADWRIKTLSMGKYQFIEVPKTH